jgi:hypothetical protein
MFVRHSFVKFLFVTLRKAYVMASMPEQVNPWRKMMMIIEFKFTSLYVCLFVCVCECCHTVDTSVS